MLARLRDEARQMQQPTGVRLIWGGQIEADFAGWAEVGVSHVVIW